MTSSRRSFLRGLLALPAVAVVPLCAPAQKSVQFNGPGTYGGDPGLCYAEFPGPWLVQCEGFSFKTFTRKPDIGKTMSVIYNGREFTGKVLSVSLLG